MISPRLNLTRTILINLCKEFFKLFLSRSEPHGSHDLSQTQSHQNHPHQSLQGVL